MIVAKYYVKLGFTSLEIFSASTRLPWVWVPPSFISNA